MGKLLRFWGAITGPRAADQDEARQEYMSKVILVMTGATLLVCTVPIVIGWLIGALDFVPVGMMLTLDSAVGIAYWLAHRGYWRHAILIPVALFFLMGLYGSYFNGLATILNFFYVLVILLTAIFCRWRMRLLALGICIVAPLLIERVLNQTPAKDLLYGGIPFAGLLIGVALLQWFLTEQLQHALAQARAYAAELDEYRGPLEELVEERYQALQSANQELEQEIAERERAEEALRRAHSELESRVEQRTAALTEANAMLEAEVDERKQAESQREAMLEALRESEGRYSQLLKHAPAGIYELDLLGSRFISVNDVMCEYTGYTREEFLSLSPLDVLTEESKQHFFERYEKIAAGEQVPETAEFQIRGKNNREFWVLLNSKFTYGEDGSISAMVIVHDITERKQAEEELRQSMAELQNLQHITNALLSLDELSQVMATVSKGIVDHLGFDVVLVNRYSKVDREFSGLALYPIPRTERFRRMLNVVGYPDLIENPTRYRLAYQKGENPILDRVLDGESVISDALADFFHPWVPKSAALAMQEFFGIESLVDLPMQVKGKTVGMILAGVRNAPITPAQQQALARVSRQAAVAIENARLMQDLEESLQDLKKAQAQLIQAQKIEAVGRLAGGVAHDFNNLLTIIQVNTQLLMQQLRPKDPLFEHVKQIQQADERAAELTQQLLRFGRRELIEPRPVNLNQTIGDLERMLQRLVGDEIELITNLADDLWPVRVDPAQMEQMMVSLVMNARDAMPLGGCLSLETANMLLDEASAVQHAEAAPGEYALLAVGDTGVGMDEHVKAHVFEPFFTTKEQGRGVGLGLSTVYGIVKQNGGHIWVYSEVGQGTTFKIYLPRAEAAVEPIEPPSRAPQPAPVRGSETILVVEDEKAVRKLAVQILQAHGYQVLEAGDGIEALEVSEQTKGPIHLLLTDVVMPRMNGKELAQQLQAQRGGVRVLYMSGYSDDVIEHHGILETGAGFLPKPFTLEALTETVRTILDSPQTSPKAPG